MTATLPDEVQQVFERFVTTEYTTVDLSGQPITWPVTPYYGAGAAAIDVTTGLGYPKKADDAARNPRVSLLFSDPTGSGLERPPGVLVQGTAEVDDRDLPANRERYARESVAKLPATKEMYPPKFIAGMFDWYFTRVYVHVRPERVFVWPGGDFTAEPQLFDTHLEEVRSHHSEEPEMAHPAALRGAATWDDRMEELRRQRTAVLTIVAPDGFPMSCRVTIEPDRPGNRVRLGELPECMPATAGRACLCAHEHHPEFKWQTNFQVRGTLVEDQQGWALLPSKLVGGLELPPGAVKRWSVNARKMLRFRKNAKRELKRRTARS
jgi:pyridoxamine 5'-phosphate oxidase-like protein